MSISKFTVVRAVLGQAFEGVSMGADKTEVTNVFSAYEENAAYQVKNIGSNNSSISFDNDGIDNAMTTLDLRATENREKSGNDARKNLLKKAEDSLKVENDLLNSSEKLLADAKEAVSNNADSSKNVELENAVNKAGDSLNTYTRSSQKIIDEIASLKDAIKEPLLDQRSMAKSYPSHIEELHAYKTLKVKFSQALQETASGFNKMFDELKGASDDKVSTSAGMSSDQVSVVYANLKNIRDLATRLAVSRAQLDVFAAKLDGSADTLADSFVGFSEKEVSAGDYTKMAAQTQTAMNDWSFSTVYYTMSYAIESMNVAIESMNVAVKSTVAAVAAVYSTVSSAVTSAANALDKAFGKALDKVQTGTHSLMAWVKSQVSSVMAKPEVADAVVTPVAPKDVNSEENTLEHKDEASEFMMPASEVEAEAEVVEVEAAEVEAEVGIASIN